MARLILNTLPDLNSVAAFVATSEGVPKSGLGLSNFRVRAAFPGADGAFITVSEVAPSTLRGFYVLNLTPLEFGSDLTDDVNALGFESLQVADSPSHA